MLAAKFPTQRENRGFERGEVQSDFRMTFSEGTAADKGALPAPAERSVAVCAERLSGSLIITVAGAGSQADVKRSCGRA